jgi:hypothetical protein
VNPWDKEATHRLQQVERVAGIVSTKLQDRRQKSVDISSSNAFLNLLRHFSDVIRVPIGGGKCQDIVAVLLRVDIVLRYRPLQPVSINGQVSQRAGGYAPGLGR